MEIDKEIKQLATVFPFGGYMSASEEAYINVANSVRKYLPTGGRILDFGAGPCDKTAVLQRLGYQCTAFDDLSDDWHLEADNRDKILSFARQIGIEYVMDYSILGSAECRGFDMVMLHDVLEHLHDSPRDLLNDLLALVKDGGLLFITVPNAVNLRKRISVLSGKTNLPAFDSFYWNKGPWRGHIREYVKGDLSLLSDYLGLEKIELRSCHHMLRVLPAPARPFFRAITCLFPGWRDSWLLIARKPSHWQPSRNLNESDYAAMMSRINLYNR
ncbi:class I SAM-dependent methyltransferase [Motiliproteus coralliicola]|nr:methyltransferase domain-containing protein [Motiliproteus coralliicola]